MTDLEAIALAAFGYSRRRLLGALVSSLARPADPRGRRPARPRSGRAAARLGVPLRLRPRRRRRGRARLAELAGAARWPTRRGAGSAPWVSATPTIRRALRRDSRPAAGAVAARPLEVLRAPRMVALVGARAASRQAASRSPRRLGRRPGRGRRRRRERTGARRRHAPPIAPRSSAGGGSIARARLGPRSALSRPSTRDLAERAGRRTAPSSANTCRARRRCRTTSRCATASSAACRAAVGGRRGVREERLAHHRRWRRSSRAAR